MSVLLAEDNPTNQMVASHMLESLGAEVTIASDGLEALEMLGEKSFDVALVDIEMPRISGIDLIRQLRADPGPVARMPMIALTAYVMREHRAAIEDAGADGIIAKPIVSIAKFGGEILAHVRQRHARNPPPDPAADPSADGAGGLEPEQPDFDCAIFESLCGSFEADGRRELVRRVGDDIGEACEAVAGAVQIRDFDALRIATHPLMAVAGVIGALRLRSLATRLNSAGHAGDDSTLDDDGSELLFEAERVLQFVCQSHEETVR